MEKEDSFSSGLCSFYYFSMTVLNEKVDLLIWFQENISCVPILGTGERKFFSYHLESFFELMAILPPPSNNFG